MSGKPKSEPAALSIEIAASIRERMARQQITKAMLADMTGISLRQLTRLLTAERHMNVEQFVGICHASGMSAPAVLALAEASVRDGHDEK
ncbi:helix-turn-helix domain-containing protein [Homoserinimonas sp. A520]